MSVKKFAFTTNWNGKLGCNAFTTIRISNEFHKVGETFEVNQKGRLIGLFKIVHKRQFKLEQITDGMAYLDTGYDRKKTIDLIKRIYSSKDYDWNTVLLDYILLVKEK